MTTPLPLDRLPEPVRARVQDLYSNATEVERATACGLLERVDLMNEASVASYLNLPQMSEFPTAGQARTWGRNEWGAWADAHGYVYMGDTSHSWAWHHPYYQALVIGVAKTPGDFRTPMALATSVRRAHRRMLDLGSSVCLATLYCILGDSAGKDDFEAVTPMITGDSSSIEVGSEAYWKLVQEFVQRSAAQCFHKASPALLTALRDDHHTVNDVRQLLARIVKERGMPARTAISIACEVDRDEAERIYKVLTTLHGMEAAHAGLFDGLTDLLVQLREEEKAERETKQAARDAERVEVKPADEPTHAREQVQRVFDNRRAAAAEQLGAVMKAAQSTLDRARFALEQLPHFQIPPLADGGAAALKQEVEQLKAQLREAKEEAERAKDARNRLGEVEVPWLKGEVERLKAYQGHAAAFAQLCIDTVASAQTLNPFQLVAALQTLQSSARELLPPETPAPCAAAG